jgi:hypothetical protein
MTAVETPSPLLGTFVRSGQKSFPATQRGVLDTYSDAISKSTSAKDHERARHCALWAIEQAADRNQSHPRWREVKELHQIWKDAWFGTEFGTLGAAGHLDPMEEIRIQWVEDAVAVAVKLGEEDGWEHSPWEPLLQELIRMEDSSTHA